MSNFSLWNVGFTDGDLSRSPVPKNAPCDEIGDWRECELTGDLTYGSLDQANDSGVFVYEGSRGRLAVSEDKCERTVKC